MGRAVTRWPWEIRHEPEVARMRLLSSLIRMQGVIPDTATELGVSIRTVHRAMKELDLQEEAMKIRLDNDIPARGKKGPRRKTVVARETRILTTVLARNGRPQLKRQIRKKTTGSANRRR